MKINGKNIERLVQLNNHKNKQITPEKNIENNKISDLPNVYYNPVSFGRSWTEHKSWGGVIDPKTKEASFKIFTFPDVKKVTVTIQKANKSNTSTDQPEEKEYELESKGGGIFETKKRLSPKEAEHGDKYYYTLYRANGDIEKVKDPYSFKQESILGASTLYDHSLFEWNDSDWFKNNKQRLSRQANAKNGLTPINKARIYEFNTATITNEGNFDSAKTALKEIKDMGFNAIEIMPVENTYSFNWGYDGVDKHAPSEYLGGPDKLKGLIDYAHSIGLNVIMDMVPNHQGPDGSALGKTGPYLKGPNAFGDAFNFEGENSRYVRDFIVNAAINWLDNYHCDGLRLDMTKFMESDYTMKQIAAEINYHKPEAFLIAEDGRNNDSRVTSPLNTEETGEGYQDSSVHINALEKISADDTSLDNLGFDSEWDFRFYHTIKDALYGNVNLDAFENDCYSSQGRVKYVYSHDEKGNFEGTALIAKHIVPMLHLNENIVLDEKDIARAKDLSALKSMSFEDAKQTIIFQKAQFTAEKLAILLQTGQLEKYNPENAHSSDINETNNLFIKEVLIPLGIKENSDINYDDVKTIFQKSYAKHKLGLAATFTTPGPKMIFQGDEDADLTPFRFFRQFDSIKHEPYLYTEKGYEPGIKALESSKMGNIAYSEEALKEMEKFRNLTTDLNKLNEENPAISTGQYIKENTVKHPYSQVIGLHTKDEQSNNEIFTVSNFSHVQYPAHGIKQYYIKFPPGQWVEILNTDDKNYGGDNNTNKSTIIYGNGNDNQPINIAEHSAAIFKRIA